MFGQVFGQLLRHLARALCLASCLVLASPPEPVPSRLVLYPRGESDLDPRQAYPLALLRLALAKSGQAFTPKASDWQMQQRRAGQNLRQRHGVDVFWTMTTPEREAWLRPVRFPVFQGLLGVRLLLVHADRSAELAEVRGLAQLQALRGAQGHDWPDLDIQRAAGLRVDAVNGYEQLFSLLAGQRVDYVLRSVVEIWHEQADRPALAVAPGLGVCYPAVAYFFVNPEDEQLAQALATGLARAQADGSFRQLFRRHYGALLARSHLAQRRWIQLPNPLLPEAARADAKSCDLAWLKSLAD